MKFQVSAQENGTRLLAFLKAHAPAGISAKALKRAIDAKKCKINGRIETFSTHALKTGDRVELALEIEEQVQLTILYENDDLLICNKPPGLVSENQRINAALPIYRGKLLLAHRLDKETSGALILAKSASAKEHIVKLFFQKKVHKVYLAIVDGEMAKNEGVIDNYLGKKHSYQGQTIYGVVPQAKGQHAVTAWRCLKKGRNTSLLRCEPLTGRTHQLRVHLSGMGHPILGDTQYGRHFKCPYTPKRHLLHAYELSFDEIKVTAPLPNDFLEAQSKLNLNTDLFSCRKN